ncbi:MCE family protein [Nocardioides sp. CPCC 205120]|uniref:MCE family protein n=1 Tax=Nocardioides sp. CPCC 205120 TaxID=3406462 RepID=UPI003B50434C
MTARGGGRRRAAHGVAALVLGLGLAGTATGCGLLEGGVYDAPLPGGADVGDDPMTLTVEFDDVLDLVPQSAVKVDDVPVGRVSSIRLADDGLGAEVELLVNSDVELPAGTSARLQQTSLLGEKYVSLDRPAQPVAGAPLDSGARIARADTDQAAQVEQVLGALSLVLNGGGIAQFQEISRELQAISGDDPGQVRAFLQQLDGLVTQLDERKGSITAVIDSLAALSGTLEEHEAEIVSALDGLHPGLEALEAQRPQLVAMLESLESLSTIAVDTLDTAQDDIVADLQLLAPVLEQLAAAGTALPDALGILLTYPFPDAVVGAIRGDYLNVFVTTAFASLPGDCTGMGCWWPQPPDPGAPVDGGAPAGRPLDRPLGLLPPTSSATPGLPSPSVTVPTPTGTPPHATGGPTTGPTTGPTGTPSAPPSSAPPSSPATGSPTTSPTGTPSAPTTGASGPSTSQGDR